MMVVINLSTTFISHRQSIKGHHNDAQDNDTKHNVNITVRSMELSIMTPRITTLSLITLSIVTLNISTQQKNTARAYLIFEVLHTSLDSRLTRIH
jgi:hypothetical protein